MIRRLRDDVLQAQSARLYEARMAVFGGPLLRSFTLGDPELVRGVLAGPAAAPKCPRSVMGLRPLVGGGSFAATGAAWRRQRRVADALASATAPGRNLDVLDGAAIAAVESLGRGGVFEAQDLAGRASLDALHRALCRMPAPAGDLEALQAGFARLAAARPTTAPAVFAPLPPSLARHLLPAEAGRAAGEIRGVLSGWLTRASAPDDGAGPTPFSALIAASPDAAAALDELATAALAAHGASASCLAWALWLLAAAPDSQERVAAEAARLPEAVPGAGDVAALRHTRAVVLETLRLYPPLPMLVRRAGRPAVWRGVPVRARDLAVVSLWHLHRHRRHWADPDRFDPGRWLAATPPRRGAFLPFSAGPRRCPNAGLAMTMATLQVARLVAALRLATVPGRQPRPAAALTVRSTTGLWVRATPRAGPRPQSPEPAAGPAARRGESGGP